MDYLFEKINYLKSYDVFNEYLEINILELKNHFATRAKHLLVTLIMNMSHFIKGAREE